MQLFFYCTSYFMHLVVHKLFKSVSSRQVLQGINLEIGSGQLAVVLGPRYSGKTTLLRIIAGIDKPAQGSVFLQGANITATKVGQRGIGMIFDRPHFFKHLDIYQNLQMVIKKPANSSLTNEDVIRSVAEELRFSHLLLSLPGDLTPMQLFTAQLVRALLNNPSLLLVDDPFEQVDGSHFNEIRLLLKKQSSRHGRTMIVTTKFADQAQLMANVLAVIDQGLIKQVDTPERVYRQPADLHVANTVYTQGFNIIPARIKSRFKRFIDCVMCESITVRIHITEDALTGYDRDTIYLCLTSNDFFLEQGEHGGMNAVQARLLAVESSETKVCSHWYLDQDTFLEVHTKSAPKVPVGSVSSLYFDSKQVFIYSAQGKLLSNKG